MPENVYAQIKTAYNSDCSKGISIVYLEMFRTFISVGVAFTLFFACLSCSSPTKKEAQKLSNTLLVINDSVFARGKALGVCIGEAINNKDYTKIAPVRQSYEDYIDSCGRYVKHMDDTGGSEQLRRAELAVLGYEKNMVHNDLAMFEKLKPDARPNDISILFQIGKKDAKRESDLISKFREIQQEYAKKNGF